ncbi:enhancer of mRNA-decapping protein 4 homolog [Drosophila subpulchrella]|uniref:enhancer of mRNA-decapping protein 4 homolog n=1 Tax=Drosophila subpulchrella TaxID=1486046 RepID=UPI0018A1AA5E|nr:enhancer of mRNA-decapping protein 4 homolog [Drosophila subpulchrella]XP_037708077.1 enhancer of mRNA-decapping protein 4 homolog [Drosophila subpulchrella]XP_037708078.1 enhancer of mRNA-decapping protein 4 homolog [Drosophila subpulchrella]
MLIALFALAHLPIFRKTPPPAYSPPPPSVPRSPRCGRARSAYHPSPADVRIRIRAPAIDAASGMSNSADQDKPIAANGNAAEPQDVEIIHFQPQEKQCCRVIKTNKTKVLTSGGVHTRGSSKVKLKNIVDYKWERKYYYPGHLVAVHRDGKHLAYAINVNNKATGMEGMVRVCNIASSMRALIKGMSGEVLDLQFAHTDRERILAVIDVSSLFVYKVDQIEGNLLCNLVLKVEDPIPKYVPEYDMVSWCPYVCSSNSNVPINDDDDENQLLIWSRSSQFQCFQVKMIVSEHGRGKIQPAALETGYLKIEEDSLITCAALSPDGTTVAAACADGLVRFYQIYLFDVRNHRCLHEWKPHDGKKVCSLFFLDNINKPVEDSYWQHVITTSDANTEIKLWNCSLWECLQTINVVASSPSLGQPANFIAGIDRSANYLVLSCLDSLAVYVMQIGNISSEESEDKGSDSEEDGSESSKRIQNVAEFKLSSGILSFSIVNASMRRVKSSIESYYPIEEPDDFDDDTNSTSALVLHMFVVQAKSLQECQIIYQPCVAEKQERRSLSSKRSETPEDHLLIKQEPESPNTGSAGTVQLDALFAKSAKRSSTGSSSAIVAVAAAAAAAPSAIMQEATKEVAKSESPQLSNAYPQQVNLMTPDAFSASGTSTATAVVVATSTTTSTGADSSAADGGKDRSIDSAVLQTLRMLATVTSKSAETPNADVLINLMNNTLIEDREQQKLKEKLDARKKFIAIDRNPERNVAENLASGGSSPSREVQEIMATQEDADAYEAELENLDDDDDDEEEELANSSPLLEAVDGTWPIVKLQSLTNSAELQNAAQIMSQAVQNTNNGNVPPTLGGGNNNNTSVGSNSNNNTATTLNTSNSSSNDNAGGAGNGSGGNGELNAKMELLLDLVKAQSKQLNKLENEVIKLQKQQEVVVAQHSKQDASLEPKNVSQLAYKIEMQLSKLMEQYLKRYENEHKKKLTEFLAARESQNRELRDSVLQVLNQYVMSHFTDIIGNVLNMELQRQLLPRVNAKMDQLQAQMQVEIVQKLSGFDKAVKENIAQVCKSKQFLDTFGKSVLMGVQASLQTAFIESMSSTLIPAYEKSSQNMFKQLHDAFSVGIKDFMVQFNTYLQHMPQPQAVGANSEELNNKLTMLKQLVESSLHKHRTELTDAMLETQREVKSLEILLARQVQETIRAELRKHMETQSMAMRSQAATPAPPYDLRDSIKQLLLAGQINKAFHQALLANDLSLVEFTLRHTDSNQAFAPEGCRLEQKVLLSLIQQISADMTNHNELKQRYLNEALLAINMADPITREHAPKVLSELYRNCQQFIKNSPKNSQFSNVRLLMKAIITYRDQLK